MRLRTTQYHLHLLSALLALLTVLAPQLGRAQQVSFGTSGLQGESSTNPTSLQFGPDNRLYVAQKNGTIYAYTVQRSGKNNYQAVSTEPINLVKNIPNYNDDGTSSNEPDRQVTGLLVVGTAQNPVLYVTSSDPRIGAGGGGTDKNLDTNSGIVSRLTCIGGLSGNTCAQWEMVHLVRGLPRSEENHATNGMQLDAATNTLYLAVGGHTNAGAPSNNFAFTTEYALSAALLEIDLDAIDAMSVKTDAKGQPYLYDLPTLDDPTRPNINGKDFGDPFGGNDGLNQAKIVPGGPVQIYSPGYRNLYDLVLTESGRMYGIDNGANGNWGGFPEYEESYDCTQNYLNGEPGSTGNGPSPATYPASVKLHDGANGTVASNGQPDKKVNNKNGLHLITKGYYAGHPTPIRGNPAGAGLYFNDTFYAPGDPNLPVDWPPVPVGEANPVECDFQNSGEDDGSLANYGPSTNGITEYTASNFGGALKGDLLAAGFSGSAPIYHIQLNATGDEVLNCPDVPANCNETLFSGFGSQPLDVTALGDDGPFPGTVWAATYGANTITVFEPADYDGGDVLACGGGYDDSIDNDDDGYSNADEIDNGTDPCSAGSQPDDNDGTFAADGFKDSNLNDPDDDDDGLADLDDHFALDPDNGTKTSLPIRYEFFNETPGVDVSFFGLGFTGLMNNGSTDYLDQFVPRDQSDDGTGVVAGGTAGLLTVTATGGDTYQNNNSQDNAFQFGIDVDAGTPPFTVHGQINAPFFNDLPPKNYQSQGLYLGTGDQDHYLKLVLRGNGGTNGFEVLYEEDAKVQTQFDTDVANVLAADVVALYFQVDPAGGSVQPQYSLDGGSVVDLGSPITLTGNLLKAVQGTYTNAGQPSGLAVGVLSTHYPPSSDDPFNATWDFLYIDAEATPSIADALVKIDVGGLDGSTYGGGFSIENTSDVEITGVTFDFSTAILPELVFDPNGTAGDATAKAFTPTNGSGSIASATPAYDKPYEGGFYELDLDFSGFGAGETYTFALDVDPISIKGGSSPGPNKSGSVSGLELAGTTVTVAFANGETLAAELYRIQPGSLGGSQNIVRGALPAAPVLQMLNLSTPATTALADQTARVVAPAGTDVSLLVLETGLFVADLDGPHAGVGYDIDPYEVNSVIDVQEFDATVGSGGYVDFDLSLAQSDPEAGYYYLAAVATDSDGATSPLSNVAVVRYDPDGALANLPPEITPITDQLDAEGAQPDLTVGATDPDNGPENLAYSASGLPAGLDIEPTNGHIFGIIAAGAAAQSPYLVTVTVSDGAASSDAQFTWQVTGPAVSDGEVLHRVNVGGPLLAATDASNPDWSVDTQGNASPFLVGGNSATFSMASGASVPGPIDVSHPSIPAGTPATIFDTERYDPDSDEAMQWSFPVTAGTEVDVRLYLAEIFLTDSGPNSNANKGPRIFDVAVDGVVPTAFDDIDVYAEVGSAAGLVKTFRTTSDGQLDLAFLHVAENPAVKGIEILAIPAASTPSIAVTAPAPGAVLAGDAVTVSWTVQTDTPTDHVHLALDDGTHIGSLPLDGSYTFTGLAAGPHTVTAEVANQDHVVYTNPEATALVSFTMEDASPAALVTVTPNQGLGASTFNNNSLLIENTGDVAITSVTVDLGTALLPDVVFDPTGTAGDSVAKCVAPGTGQSSTGYVTPDDACADPFSQAHNGLDGEDGYDAVTVAFSDFNPGETFGFSVDIDPTSIKNDANSGDAGAVSGFELVGSTVTVTFETGTTITASLWEDGSLGGAQAVVQPGAPAAPVLTLAGLSATPALVTDPNQTVEVSGPAGADVALLLAEGRLHLDAATPATGYDVDAFEANEMLSKALYTATIGPDGTVTIPVTLARSADLNVGPDGGINHLRAVVLGTNGQTSLTSNALVLELGDAEALHFAATLAVAEQNGDATTLTFGTAPEATDAFDPAFDGEMLPPAPPDGFYARFACSDDNAACASDEELTKDFRGPITEGETITWTVAIRRASSSNPVVLDWSDAMLPEGSFRLVDGLSGGQLVDVDMQAQTSYAYTGENAGVFELLVVHTLGEPVQPVDVLLAEGWNLVGLPFETPTGYQDAFPTAVENSLYAFNGVYQGVDAGVTQIELGKGYWLQASQDGTTTVEGDAAPVATLTLAEGWNLIAGPNCSLPLAAAQDPDGLLDPSTLYTFDGVYQTTSSLVSGEAYWVNASADGTVTLDCASAAAAAKQPAALARRRDVTSTGLLRVRDHRGHEQTLLLGGDDTHPSYAMPPRPPQGAFDVRFQGDSRRITAKEGLVELQASHFPVEMAWSVPAGSEGGSAATAYVIEVLDEHGAVTATHRLEAGGSLQLTDARVTRLRLREAEALPMEFALGGSYPNPSRGRATILVDLPEAARVTVEVFDVLGRRVARVFEGEVLAGRAQRLQVDGSRLASGTYFYRVEARFARGAVVETGRMTLVR